MHSIRTRQKPRRISYIFPPDGMIFFADDQNYQKILNLQIELYTKTKRYDLEERVEAVLQENGFVYDVTEDYIDSDGVFMITYTMEVYINAG